MKNNLSKKTFSFKKKAELSEVTIAIIIGLIIIFIGLAIFFLKAKDFKSSLGM